MNISYNFISLVAIGNFLIILIDLHLNISQGPKDFFHRFKTPIFSELMVKFDRQDVINILTGGNNVEIKITGELNDGTVFEGVDYIKVI